MKQSTDALGLYLSFPFCKTKCTYCNFASNVFPASLQEPYVERLIGELRNARSFVEAHSGGAAELPAQVDSVYFGGGTPSLLTADQLQRLSATMRENFEIQRDAEITLEAMPGEIGDELLAAMPEVGVNRISLGVQSFVDGEVRLTGRKHSCAVIAQDLARLRGVGISNINLDLIAGLPMQSAASWGESLEELIASGVPHASVYMFEVDEESRLGKEVLDAGSRYHAAEVPSDDAMAEHYATAIERLNRAGVAQYEISNFCREGYESRHNLRYWQRRPYLGVGLDASSGLRGKPNMRPGEMLRFTSTWEIEKYLAAAKLEECNWQTVDESHEEAWFLGLRCNKGVVIDEIAAEFGAERVAKAMAAAREMAAEGLLDISPTRVRLTEHGRLLSNTVFARFLELGE